MRMPNRIELVLKPDERVAVISDLHLTGEENEKTNGIINALLNKADILIVNGDFSDKLFTTLKSWRKTWGKSSLCKKAILIKGNHDFPSLVTTECAILKTKRYTYFISHGHKPNKHNLILRRIVSSLDRLMVRLLGRFWIKCFYRSLNSKQKKHEFDNNWHIVSHTHCAEIDVKNKYINTGQFKDGVYDITWITNQDLWQERIDN